MKHINISLLAACSAFVLLANCKKKTEDPISTTDSTGKIITGLKSIPQEFKVTAGLDQTILAKDSTIIHFYPNSFKDASGNIITSGTISIQLIEMYKTGEMIANNASTQLSDGQPLQSGGQVYIKAVADADKEVFANKYGISFRQPTASNTPMELYYGDNSGGNTATKWVISPANIGTRSISARKDSTSYTTRVITVSGTTGPTPYVFPGFRYIFDSCTNFHWVNCDHPFVNKSIQMSIDLTIINEDLRKNNLKLFIVFPSYLNVTEIYPLYIKNETSQMSIAYAPLNTPYKLYLIGTEGDKYYYLETSGNVTDTIHINAELGEENLFNIKSRLGAI